MVRLTGQQVYDKIYDSGNASPIDVAVMSDEVAILNDLLLFDKEQNIANGTNGYYAGTSTDWTLKLSRITQSDIKKYVKDVNSRGNASDDNIGIHDINNIFDEALKVTLAEKDNSLASSGLFSINAVTGFFSALQDNNYSGDAIAIANIKQAVTAFDKHDGKGVNKVTARDLNDFANAYRLSDAQRAKLVSFYSNIAEIEERNGDDKIIEIP